MFKSFHLLLNSMEVFNRWNVESNGLADRINSIKRKLYNSMFFVEAAEKFPHTNDIFDGFYEMRALDAYLDGILHQIHGALDMFSSAISYGFGVQNKKKQSYSFAQMFNGEGKIDDNIKLKVGDTASEKLQSIYSKARSVIKDNNTSKHRALPNRMLVPKDYPDYMLDLSLSIMKFIPHYNNAGEVRNQIGIMRVYVKELGIGICDAFAHINWPNTEESDDSNEYEVYDTN